ncbi:MAG: (4Fe-4S)-binding protein [bacterium]
MSVHTYPGDGFTVTYDPALCIHCGECVLGLPAVFNTTHKPWIMTGKAPPEAIEAQVSKCPSGALGFAEDSIK